MRNLNEFLNEDRLGDIKRKNLSDSIYFLNKKGKELKTSTGSIKSSDDLFDFITSGEDVDVIVDAIFEPNNKKGFIQTSQDQSYDKNVFKSKIEFIRGE